MRLLLLGVALLFCPPALGESPSGRWASHDNVAMAGSKAGSKFFLDVTIAADGSFKGTWEEYVCFSYTGAYGIVTVSCQRSKKPQPASGRLDAARGTGSLELAKLGKGSFLFKTAPNAKGLPQMAIELPRDWLKQGDPILYETSLNPRSR
jgi:hypothetical protein